MYLCIWFSICLCLKDERRSAIDAQLATRSKMDEPPAQPESLGANDKSPGMESQRQVILHIFSLN